MNTLYSLFTNLLSKLDIFESAPRVAVGVSGGPDSLALVFLLNKWVREKGGSLIALIVDHGLRPESCVEAHEVSIILQAQGISSVLLSWKGEKPSQRIQESARLARYKLLEAYCWEQGIFHLFIAHHKEDQAETFLARIGKKSGLTGLCAMNIVEERWFGCLIRPLLYISKEDLICFLKSEDIPFFIDPSNLKEQFERVRLRQYAATLQKVNITSEAIMGVIEKLQQANNDIEETVSIAYLESVFFSPFGWAEILLSSFLKFTKEVQYRLLEGILQTIGGREFSLRSSSLRELLDNIREGKSILKTLSHCLIRKRGHTLFIVREEVSLPNLPLTYINNVLWGGLYYIEKKKEQQKNLTWELRSLGRKGAELLQKKGFFSFKYSSYLTHSFPSLWEGSVLLSVPYLNFQRDKWEEGGLSFPICAPHVPLTSKMFFPCEMPKAHKSFLVNIQDVLQNN